MVSSRGLGEFYAGRCWSPTGGTRRVDDPNPASVSAQRISEAVRNDIEHLADVFEGKPKVLVHSATVVVDTVAHYPLLRFDEEALVTDVRGMHVGLKAVNCVLEHSDQQSILTRLAER